MTRAWARGLGSRWAPPVADLRRGNSTHIRRRAQDPVNPTEGATRGRSEGRVQGDVPAGARGNRDQRRIESPGRPVDVSDVRIRADLGHARENESEVPQSGGEPPAVAAR